MNRVSITRVPEHDSAKFTCNVCGADCGRPAAALAREMANCPGCGSTVRLRALLALLSQEIFGVLLTLPEFPVLKGIRGIGMSDVPDVACRLAEKFDYTNTFYHQAPWFDVTQPDARDQGRHDFILSSEVMEHVPPPVERAFATIVRMLKPDGLLLLTTPYNVDGKTVEHFPELYLYTLAAPGGRTVLVNRRRDGSVEVFGNLDFHGGHGSTLEMRKFTESSLRAVLVEAGFTSVHFAAASWPEFGIEHAETWSLPIAARKGRFQLPAAELAREYREACRRAARAQHDLASVTAEYQRHVSFHGLSHAELERQLAERIEWAWQIEREYEERSLWAVDVEREKDQAVADFARAEKLVAQARERLETLEGELNATRAELVRLQAAGWTRLGRNLGFLS